MKREFVENIHYSDGVKLVSAAAIENWGFEHGFRFPNDFIDFFARFGGAVLDDDFGYEFTFEKDESPTFAEITRFLHFDPDVVRNSVEDQYTLRCTDHWDQPLLVPFADTEINTFAVLDFRKSRRAPAIYNVDFFDTSKDDPERPNMTWLADSFTEFLDLLEPYDSFLTRYGRVKYS